MIRLLGACALLSLLVAAPARAWTDATVRTASAHLVLARDGSIDVTLVAELRVDGGWLQSFEIDGLDPDLVLIPDRPALFEEATTGTALSPRTELRDDGRIVFSFTRRSGPRRGDYIVTVAFRTHAAIEVVHTDRVRARWTLPGWRFGLDDVNITVDAPEGAVAVTEEGEASAVEITELDADQGTRWAFRRIHLPRTRDWSIALDVPSVHMDASLSIAPPLPPTPQAPSDAPSEQRDRSQTILLWVFLALLAGLKIRSSAIRDEHARASSRPLVPLSASWRMAIASLLAGAGLLATFLLDRIELECAAMGLIACCAIHLRTGAPRTARLGAFQPASHGELRAAMRAYRIRFFDPLDAWTPLGAICWAALLSLLIARIEVISSALSMDRGQLFFAYSCALSMVLSGSLRSRPSSPRLQLGALLELARSLRIDPNAEHADWALRPVLHVEGRGQPQEARLRVVPSFTPKGLLRLDVVIAGSPKGNRWRQAPRLLVVVREASAADRALDLAFPNTRFGPASRRIARSIDLEGDLGSALGRIHAALAPCPREEQVAANASETLVLRPTG